MVDTPTVERLGRYRLLRRLGRGGMATVYHAVQEGPLGFENEVAVKVVHPELLEEHPFLIQNLVDEARIAARVRHPNIVRILDLVEEGERFYLVMDYVDGVSMRQVLDTARQSRSLPPAGPVLEVLSGAARGLDAAHRLTQADGSSMGLVHRDVKPGNILVSHDGLVKVSDFGVALFGDRITEATMTGQMKGTPAYMSPEQALGDPVSFRSDIFSLGLTLYTLITTKLVHRAESAVRLAMKIATEPVDDQAAELEALVPGLGAVFLKACAKDPADRYADATLFADAVDTVYGTLKAPASIAEMVVATGWRAVRLSSGQLQVEPLLAGHELALADTDDLALSLDEVGPVSHDSLSLDNSWDPATEDDDEEPTVAGAAVPIQPSVEVLGPAGNAFLPEELDDDDDDEPTDADLESPVSSLDDDLDSTVGPPDPDDPEVTPVASHAPPQGFPSGPAPQDAPLVINDPNSPNVDIVLPPPPPPGGPIPQGTTGPVPAPFVMPAPGPPPPPGPPPYVPPPPAARAETTLPNESRPQMQPVRDYRGRVVRNSNLQQNTTIGKTEKMVVAVLFFLLLLAVLTIIGLQVLKPLPDNHDPRVVDDSLPSSPDRVTLPTTTSPKPPAAPAAVKTAKAPEPTPTVKPGEVVEHTGNAEAKPGERVPGAVVEHQPTTLNDRVKAASKKKQTKKRRAPAAEPAADAEPPPAEPGTLVVNSYPWSKVFLDGKEIGTTPVRSHSLPAGKHEVKLVFPSADGQEHVQTIDVEPGGKATVIKKLDKS